MNVSTYFVLMLVYHDHGLWYFLLEFGNVCCLGCVINSLYSNHVIKDYVFDLMTRLATRAAQVAEINQEKTLSARAIQSAVRLELPGI
jgi:hypothetical protein